MSDEVRFEVETHLPTEHGTFRVRAYHDVETGDDHLALIGDVPGDHVPLVRLHSECLTGEAFGSLKCECGPQLRTAMDVVAEHGGVVLYLRGQEGRGIGLVNKLRAYHLQEEGLDTVDANLALGLPADARDYSAAAAILRDLGITQVRLLTNNPLKQAALTEHGIEVAERVPLEVGRNAVNDGYLRTKAERMGHLLHLDVPTEDEQDA
ncbi:GTP cyclohydrolase II [Gulosibacter sp. ACHW.36C]|uniref:GTP cyclohydrolase II n=1 Tax=Gulosibacter sp. ACHW.36C TaxID=3434457 RepID=UPI003D663786